MRTDDKTILVLSKPGLPIAQRMYRFADARQALDVAKWLERCGISYTRMSVATFDYLAQT